MSKSKKNVIEKKPFIAVLPVAISIVLIFGITLGIWAFSGPKANPQISNPNDPFMHLGGYTITNEQLYYALRQNYSYDEIQRFIDTELLKNITIDKNSDDYKEFKNEFIYGVKKLEDLEGDETPEEIYADFEDQMAISGYLTAEDIESYIELQYRREKFARQKYDEEIAAKKQEGRPFDKSKYQTYYNNNYLTKVTVITIVFDSETQAKSVMAKFGVNTNELSANGWITSAFDSDEPVDPETNPKTPLTEKEVKETFINMYNYMYSYYNNKASDLLKAGVHFKEETEDIKFLDLSDDNVHEFSKFVYTSKELETLDTKFKSVIIDSLKLNDSFYKAYTNKPEKLNNSSSYFLALKIEEDVPVKYVFDYDDDTDEDKIPSEALFDEIEAKLIEENFTDNVITEKLYDLRREHNLVIYDSVMEALYKLAYDNFYKNTLKLEVGKYPEFKKTKAKSKDVVMSFTVNDQKIEYKVNDFFTTLKNRYAVNASFNFMNTYLFLANKEFNEVYNPLTKEIYDKKELKAIIDSDVKMYSYYFSLNYFESQGFPKSYGWKRFLKEFFQVEDENELAVQIKVLSDAKDKFAKTFYKYDDDSHDLMSTILARMQKIYDEFFSGSVFNLIVFIDYDGNGSADVTEKDEESNWTDNQKVLAQQLTELMYETALENIISTLYDKLNDVVNEYNDALFNDAKWGQFKEAGLHVKLESSTTYTNTSPIVDEFKTEVKRLFTITKDAALDTPLIGDTFWTMYGYHKIALLSTTDYTYADKKLKKVLPTEEDIKLYEDSLLQDENTKEEDKIVIDNELKAALTFYYEPVKQFFHSDDRISLGLIDYRASVINSGDISFVDTNLKAKFDIINDALKKSTLETLEEGE